MFGWFTKKAIPATQAQRPRPSASGHHVKAEALHWDLPPSLPEVTEGNSDTDWSIWEDSVNFQESRAFANSELRTEPAPLSAQAEEVQHVFEHEALRKNR